MQDNEGFAVIWRNAQRARGELLGVWCSRFVSRLWKFSDAGWFKLGDTPRLASNMRDHVLLFSLLGLVFAATIMLVMAPGAVTWALALIE